MKSGISMFEFILIRVSIHIPSFMHVRELLGVEPHYGTLPCGSKCLLGGLSCPQIEGI
jgi:hypothetical protein